MPKPQWKTRLEQLCGEALTDALAHVVELRDVRAPMPRDDRAERSAMGALLRHQNVPTTVEAGYFSRVGYGRVWAVASTIDGDRMLESVVLLGDVVNAGSLLHDLRHDFAETEIEHDTWQRLEAAYLRRRTVTALERAAAFVRGTDEPLPDELRMAASAVLDEYSRGEGRL